MRILLALLTPALLVSASACSLVTVEQDTFPPMKISAERPPPPPPRVVLTPSSIKITEKVQFELGKDTLLPESFSLLKEVAQVLIDNPQIKTIQIEGHTDITGSAAINRKLSNGRAKSVMKYLASVGVPKDRMVAKGFGPDRPIASNDTEEGREANRRVEFNIVEQGPKKTLVQEE